jgi:hypothetical protein
MPSAQHKAADFDSQTRFCPKVVLTQPGSSANDTIKTHSTTSQGDFDRLNVTKSAQCRTPGLTSGRLRLNAYNLTLHLLVEDPRCLSRYGLDAISIRKEHETTSSGTFCTTSHARL